MSGRWKRKCDDSACPGWFWEAGEPRGRVIMRCDDCARFESDYEAAKHAQRYATIGRDKHYQIPQPILEVTDLGIRGAFVRLKRDSKTMYDRNVTELTKKYEWNPQYGVEQ